MGTDRRLLATGEYPDRGKVLAGEMQESGRRQDFKVVFDWTIKFVTREKLIELKPSGLSAPTLKISVTFRIDQG